MLNAKCDNCGYEREFSEDKSGKRFKCPICGNTVEIPLDKSTSINSLITPPQKTKSIKNTLLISGLIIFVILIVIYVLYNSDTQKSAINNERQRIEQLISKINQLIAQKKFDEALVNVNNINWLVEPDENKDYVNQYHVQRENLRNTILKVIQEQKLLIEGNNRIERDTSINRNDEERLTVVDAVIYDTLNTAASHQTIDQVRTEVDTTKDVKKVLEPVNTVDKRAFYQGKTTASKSQGAGAGTSDQVGSGVSYSLSGRSMVRTPQIKDKPMETGKVVVDIMVDKEGNIVSAIPGGRGSTTSSALLYKLAKDAVQKAKFNSGHIDADTQKGTITFVFFVQ